MAPQPSNKHYPKHMYQGVVIKNAAEEALANQNGFDTDTTHPHSTFPKKRHKTMLVHTPDDGAKARSGELDSGKWFDKPDNTDFAPGSNLEPEDQIAALKAHIAALEAEKETAVKGPAAHVNEALNPPQPPKSAAKAVAPAPKPKPEPEA